MAKKQSFEDLFSKLTPHIESISSGYTAQKLIIDSLNESTNTLLEKYGDRDGGDGILSKLDEVNTKLTDTVNGLEEFNNKIAGIQTDFETFSNALKMDKDTLDASIICSPSFPNDGGLF